jgi:hypothetical protein
METNYAGENYLLVQGDTSSINKCGQKVRDAQNQETTHRPDQAYHKIKESMDLRKLLARQESP